MAKNSKAPAGSSREAAKNFPAGAEAIDWNGLKVTVTPVIGLKEMMEFVNNVVESCFSSSGEYCPEIMDFAIACNVLTKYADFELPEDLEERYAMVCGTDAVSVVCERANREQLDSMLEAIRRRLEYRCNTGISMIEGRLNDLIAAFDKVGKLMSDAFSGVSADDVKRLIGAIGNGRLDEKAVVDAFLEHGNDGKETEG